MFTAENFDFGVTLGRAIADRAGANDALGRFGKFLSEVASTCIDWFDTANFSTPTNSHPPRVTWCEPGQWSGIVIVAAGQAAFWLAVRTADCPDNNGGSGPSQWRQAGRRLDRFSDDVMQDEPMFGYDEPWPRSR